MRALLAKRQVPVAPGGLLGWIHHDDATATVPRWKTAGPGRPTTW
jgi:hypothetical protein